MEEEIPQYIGSRLDNQIEWYGKKSAFNKERFRICQIIVIVASAAIPIVNLGLPMANGGTAYIALGITAVLGAIVTVATALSQMDSYFQTWVLYRTTGEALKRERFLYLNNAADYSGLTAVAKNKLLVERVEAMLSSENSKFTSLQQQAKQQLDQQLTDLIQQQREINKKQEQELLELREFRQKYESPGLITGKQIEQIRAGLSTLKYPTSKQDIQTYVDQNKANIADVANITSLIEKLSTKQYANIQEIVNELLK